MAEDTGFTVVENSTPKQETPQSFEIDVSPEVAFNLKLQEFDKHIANAEAQVANLKMQKATFIYDTNLQTVVQASQNKKSEAPATPPSA